MKRVKEFDLITSLQQISPQGRDVICGIGDDTAVLPYSPQHDQLLTTDTLVDGVHFDETMKPSAVGRKALACSLSDIAAMGGSPTYAVVALVVPKGKSQPWLRACYQGMADIADEFGVSLVGGDTVSGPALTLQVSLLGLVPKGSAVLRSGACVGDYIFVTGPLGCSLDTGHHLSFQPRIKEGQYLRQYVKATAMMDVSDGLASDLRHILKASQVGAQINSDNIPRRKGADLNQALTDGEDFELLFTTSPGKGEAVIRSRTRRGICIGTIMPQKHGFQLVDQAGKLKPCQLTGFDHLA